MKRMTGILHEYLCKFMIISLYILCRIINVLTKVVGKINTHFMFNSFFFENRAALEIIWKNMV